MLLRLALLYARVREVKLEALNFLIVFLSSLLPIESVLRAWPHYRLFLAATDEGEQEFLGLDPPEEALRARISGLQADRPFRLAYSTLAAQRAPSPVVWYLSAGAKSFSVDRCVRWPDGAILRETVVADGQPLFGKLVLPVPRIPSATPIPSPASPIPSPIAQR
jgi:hypothetical protein